MGIITLRIDGNPIAKKRPRFAKRGKFVMAYKDIKEETEEGKVWLQIKRQYQLEPITIPIKISLVFWIERPKNHFGSGKNLGILKNSSPKYCTTKPDIDNYIKFYLDCLNGIVFKDDSQIFEIYAKKEYLHDNINGFIEIIIEEAE